MGFYGQLEHADELINIRPPWCCKRVDDMKALKPLKAPLRVLACTRRHHQQSHQVLLSEIPLSRSANSAPSDVPPLLQDRLGTAQSLAADCRASKSEVHRRGFEFQSRVSHANMASF